ncbi:MAG: DUF4112 domain-containing protein [Candidatus Roizmanbacteria bacterium]|nr:DUF4112 domain-containing protein [Candidatus Roizmanbacteria bacterium]
MYKKFFLFCAFDWLIGCVPLVGDIFDISWKANLKNVRLVKDHIDCQNKRKQSSVR